MAIRTIRAASQATVRAKVTGTENGASADPTGGEVAMAFTSTDVAPEADDAGWVAATWDTDTTTTPTTYRAQCVVAAGDLAVGLHNLFVKFEDGPGEHIEGSGVVKVVP